jgi:hypothetical protein
MKRDQVRFTTKPTVATTRGQRLPPAGGYRATVTGWREGTERTVLWELTCDTPREPYVVLVETDRSFAPGSRLYVFCRFLGMEVPRTESEAAALVPGSLVGRGGSVLLADVRGGALEHRELIVARLNPGRTDRERQNRREEAERARAAEERKQEERQWGPLRKLLPADTFARFRRFLESEEGSGAA